MVIGNFMFLSRNGFLDVLQRVDNQIFIGMTQGGKVSGRVPMRSAVKPVGRIRPGAE